MIGTGLLLGRRSRSARLRTVCRSGWAFFQEKLIEEIGEHSLRVLARARWRHRAQLKLVIYETQENLYLSARGSGNRSIKTSSRRSWQLWITGRGWCRWVETTFCHCSSCCWVFACTNVENGQNHLTYSYLAACSRISATLWSDFCSSSGSISCSKL